MSVSVCDSELSIRMNASPGFWCSGSPGWSPHCVEPSIVCPVEVVISWETEFSLCLGSAGSDGFTDVSIAYPASLLNLFRAKSLICVFFHLPLTARQSGASAVDHRHRMYPESHSKRLLLYPLISNTKKHIFHWSNKDIKSEWFSVLKISSLLKL